ncbi:hypothetical protein SLEP1_g42964 [Rubroshorea leprosula]|nr:hypothetical protein SLEP1_g42964 [Rubroshorea leprosula]
MTKVFYLLDSCNSCCRSPSAIHKLTHHTYSPADKASPR